MTICRLSAFLLTTALLASMVVSAEESDSVLLIDEERLGDYWITERKVAPEYPRKSLRKREQGCVTVGFVIESDGTTSSHRAIASFPTTRFNSSAIRAAKQFTFSPSEKNPEREPVFTTNVFTYLIYGSEEPDEEAHEALGDLCDEAAERALSTVASDADAG